MSRASSFASAAVAVLGCLLAGCQSLERNQPGLGGTGALSNRVPNATAGERAKVFQAAVDELGGTFKQHVTDANEFAGTIACEPEFLARGGGASTNELRILSTKSDLRRTVRMRIVEDGPGVRAEVSAALQRRDTEQFRTERSMQNPSDVPSETPVSTDTGSPEHREVWTNIGRDYTLERDILAAIATHFAPTSQPGGR